MLIRARNGTLTPASEMSPLIRHLSDLWAEDIHFYAFAGQENAVTTDEVLTLLGSSEPQ